MRKSLLFGAMLLIASCTVHKEEEFQTPSQHRYHAVAEEPVDAETRVFADSKLRVRWNEGDHISIFERKTYNQEFEFLGDTGDTAGDFDPVESGGYHTGGDIEDGHVYAVYPYDKKNKCDYEGKLTVTFPSVQHYKKDSFGIGANVMVAKTNTMDLRFMHVGGYRTFKLYGEGVSVSSIRMESNGDEYLSGRTDVTIGSDGKPSVSFIESTSNSKSVELVCDTPVALGGTADEAVEFWFVLPPGTLTQGFTVTVTDIDGKEFTKSTSNSIEVKSGAKKSMPAFEVEMGGEPVISVPEAVDLGLPSGIKWASFNVGATKPEEYGDYFAWGEIAPKDSYSWDNYMFGGMYSLSKYNTDSTYGTVDNKIVLEGTDDVASINYGGYWRMPTMEEWKELWANCSFLSTTQNGVYGRLVTGSNGNSIFLPAAGLYYPSAPNYTGSKGWYWSSSIYAELTYDAYFFDFDSAGTGYGGNHRCMGFSVRPVYGEFISVESVSLNKTSLSLMVGSSDGLTVTILPSDATEKTVTWTSSNPSVATVNGGVVTAVSEGTATITAWASNGRHSATCNVTVREPAPIPEAVDLGLPSGLKWASFNLGASAPEEYGDYYAWGETEPYYSSLDPLTWKEGKEAGYTWSSYKWCRIMGQVSTLTRYCQESRYGYGGFTDNRTVLDPEDDAAQINLGGGWRMPTDDEWTELRENCTWTWATQDGVNGRLVTGSNGNSIFLPAAGFWFETPLHNVGSYGYYWSSSLVTDSPRSAWRVHFDSGDVLGDVLRNSIGRYTGQPIRPVSN